MKKWKKKSFYISLLQEFSIMYEIELDRKKNRCRER